MADIFILFVISTFNGNVFNQNNEFCDIFAKIGFQIDYEFGFGLKYVLFVDWRRVLDTQ